MSISRYKVRLCCAINMCMVRTSTASNTLMPRQSSFLLPSSQPLEIACRRIGLQFVVVGIDGTFDGTETVLNESVCLSVYQENATYVP